MPHWSSLADLCREHRAMEHPSSSCWQLVAGTFNWNKSLHKICQFVAMHTHTQTHTQPIAHIQYVSCSAATTPISPLHTWCLTRPLARRYPCCHCQYLSLFTAHSQRLFASILDLLLPSSSSSLSPTRLGSWLQISKILQLTLLLVCHTMAWHYWLGYKRVLVSSLARKSESIEKIWHSKRPWKTENLLQLYLCIRQMI